MGYEKLLEEPMNNVQGKTDVSCPVITGWLGHVKLSSMLGQDQHILLPHVQRIPYLRPSEDQCFQSNCLKVDRPDGYRTTSAESFSPLKIRQIAG
jgi:hypothetical protein